MAENILHDFHEQIPGGVTMIPSSGGIFDVSLDGAKLYSKEATGRFPNENEIEESLEALFGGEAA